MKAPTMNGDRELPLCPKMQEYEKRAKDLVKAFKSGDPAAMRWIRRYHPRLSGRPNTNDRNNVTDGQIRGAKLSLADARYIIAHQHQFESWAKFAKQIEALNQKDSPVAQFEVAADAIITGDLTTLKRL